MPNGAEVRTAVWRRGIPNGAESRTALNSERREIPDCGTADGDHDGNGHDGTATATTGHHGARAVGQPLRIEFSIFTITT
jgi:hypothetical protein